MRKGDGRPLRFLALVGCCWVGGRFAVILSATGSVPDAVRAIVPLPLPAAATTSVTVSDRSAGLGAVGEAQTEARARRRGRIAPPLSNAFAGATVAASEGADGAEGAPLVPQVTGLLAATTVPLPVGTIAALPVRDPIPIRQTSGLSVSSWAIARGGTGPGASALAPQLGGTQGGVRVDYAIGNGFAVTGRFAAPARGIGREVSLGVAWRPSGSPLRIVAEHRVALDRGRGGPALGISSGVSAVRLPARFRLEGYAQAGAIARVGIESYADASVRAARPIADMGGIAFDLGAGAWGGAQRGAARLDIGPSIGARVPVAGQALRVAIDWRQRIAGNARPGSGPALTLGTDF